ncbi:hypothetical protein Trydic_g8726 [Trypoxylus dichotomus]
MQAERVILFEKYACLKRQSVSIEGIIPDVLALSAFLPLQCSITRRNCLVKLLVEPREDPPVRLLRRERLLNRSLTETGMHLFGPAVDDDITVIGKSGIVRDVGNLHKPSDESINGNVLIYVNRKDTEF